MYRLTFAQSVRIVIILAAFTERKVRYENLKLKHIDCLRETFRGSQNGKITDLQRPSTPIFPQHPAPFSAKHKSNKRQINQTYFFISTKFIGTMLIIDSSNTHTNA